MLEKLPLTENQQITTQEISQRFSEVFLTKLAPTYAERAALWAGLKQHVRIPLPQAVGPELFTANEAEDKWLATTKEVLSGVGNKYVMVLWNYPLPKSPEGKVITEMIGEQPTFIGVISRENLSMLEGEGTEITLPPFENYLLRFANEADALSNRFRFYIFDLIAELSDKMLVNKRLTEETADAIAKTADEMKERDPTTAEMLFAAAVAAGKAAIMAKKDPRGFFQLAMEGGDELPWGMLFLGFILSQMKL